MQASSEISHAEDYRTRHAFPRPLQAGRRLVRRPNPGMCFQCHAEPVLPGGSFGLQCSIKADLSWVAGQINFGGAQ